ncbi:hypothetical protein [Streptomyces sp. NPDC054975]
MKDGTIAGRPQIVQTIVGQLVTCYIRLHKEDPEGPACGGPLFVHDDGHVECHAGCPGPIDVLHVPEALQYCEHAHRFDLLDPLDHTCARCPGTPADLCPGSEVEHQDGTVTCSLGDDCHGPDMLHPDGQSCGLFTPCEPCGITTPLLARR